MLSMLERGDKIDLYTLSQRPELKDRDMLRYFSELTSAVGSGVNVLDHARQLADTETRRRLCLFGYELAARAVSDPDGVVDWATSEITAIADRVSRPDDITPLSEVVRATIDDLERRQQARQAGECIGIPTGLQRLDALTGGWRGGQLVVLAGRPEWAKVLRCYILPVLRPRRAFRCVSIRWKCPPGSWPGVCWSAARV